MTVVLVLLLLPTVWGNIPNEAAHPITGVLGGCVSFPVLIEEGRKVNSIFWENNSTKKTMAVAMPSKTLDVKNERFQGRLKAKDSGSGYSLELCNLESEDTGTYKATLFTNSKTKYLFFKLEVNGNSRADRTDWTSRNILLVTSLVVYGIFLADKI
ncbi:SLAM family member 5 [Pelobates cultripes]|uniref:SLAM family member 5 n=1 Tax=Pelobates cultripes TaxID=61616 RepID=A0AAD1WUJ6_PELCU|nr:SLAM family member 5 [Pelobates cultripes]